MEIVPWYAHGVKKLDGLKKLSSLIKTAASNGSLLRALHAAFTFLLRSTKQTKAGRTSELPSRVESRVGGGFRKPNDLLDVRTVQRKEIRLRVTRFNITPTCTIGEMRCDQQPWLRFYTLEPLRSIPAGTYRVTLYKSPHFGRLVPLLHGVDGFSSVEIHIGNFPRDTKGCVLVGLKQNGNSIEGSKVAFSLLMGVLDGATDIQITIA